MPGILVDLSDALAGAVQKNEVSVVRVEGRRRLPASGIVWSADGVIVTAHHVVEQDDNIAIGLPGGDTVRAELVGRDPTTDVAVLRAPATGLKPVDWAAPDSVRVGHLALALGRPGQSVMATLGIVSAVGGKWQTAAGGQLDPYLQTDVAMYPGFSGGPLIDARGYAVGMNSSALLQGISVTIPAGSLGQLVATLLSHGRVRRGYLGIGAQVVRLPGPLATELGRETGLLLSSVEPGSPAEQSGLYMGDTLLAFDGQPVRHLDDLLALLTGERVGQAVAVQILRGGQRHEVPVVVGEQK